MERTTTTKRRHPLVAIHQGLFVICSSTRMTRVFYQDARPASHHLRRGNCRCKTMIGPAKRNEEEEERNKRLPKNQRSLSRSLSLSLSLSVRSAMLANTICSLRGHERASVVGDRGMRWVGGTTLGLTSVCAPFFFNIFIILNNDPPHRRRWSRMGFC
jgi:hypothetical protein